MTFVVALIAVGLFLLDFLHGDAVLVALAVAICAAGWDISWALRDGFKAHIIKPKEGSDG